MVKEEKCHFKFYYYCFGSIPCAVGYSVLSGFQPFGPGSAVLDLLDFLVSNVIMPLGSLVFCFLYSASRLGLEEVYDRG